MIQPVLMQILQSLDDVKGKLINQSETHGCAVLFHEIREGDSAYVLVTKQADSKVQTRKRQRVSLMIKNNVSQ